MKICILCKSVGELSDEHYIPKWLTKATGREDEPIKLVTQTDGVVGKEMPRGTAMSAVTKALCKLCNSKLGETLEGSTEGLLKDIVAPKPPKGVGRYLSTLTASDRETLVWWGILRAIEFDFANYRSNPRITPEISGIFLKGIKFIAYGGISPKPPDSIHFVVGRASRPGWIFGISKQLFDVARLDSDSRPTSAQAKGSFLFGFQANEFIALIAHIPEAMRAKNQGWGHSIFPQDPQPKSLPLYADLFGMWNNSFIDTRLT
jgi:hypothetical protein